MEQVLNTPKVKQERNSSFEILRIIAILFIIAHHFSVHGGFDFSSLGNSSQVFINRTWINFIAQFGKLGVNLFILISAFFLVESKFKARRVLSILAEMLFFSITLGLVFFFVNKKTFTISVFNHMFFPFGSGTWWFMVSYLLLYILSPFLNLGIHAMNKKMHLALNILFIVIWSILPTFTDLNYGFSNFGWFITLYLVASYIRLYDVSIKVKPIVGFLIFIGIFALWFAIECGFKNLFDNNKYIVAKVISWFNYIATNNFLQFFAAVVLFLSFKNIKMKNVKAINLIASTTLAIYLFHDFIDMSNFLWIKLFKNASYASSPVLIPYSLGVILAVFAMGVVVGLVYKYTLGFGVNKILNFLDKKCLYKIDNVFNKSEEAK